jgi:hypothetical protein
LDLSECSSLDDGGLKGIAERCIHLKKLAVCWCDSITDTGISMVINHCNQLCVLNLKGLWCITGEGWLTLVPLHVPHLRELCLLKCYRVVRKYVKVIMAALPELKITM